MHTTQSIICLALFEHGLIHRKFRQRSKEPELRNNRLHIGILPPADLLLRSIATCFPMITRPSLVPLDMDDVNNDTLAINYVVCKPVDFHQLLDLQPHDNEELIYIDVSSKLTPVATNGISFSIDFLPHFEDSTELCNSCFQLTLPAFYPGTTCLPTLLFFKAPHFSPIPTPMVHQMRLLNLHQEQESSPPTLTMINNPSSSTAMESPTTGSQFRLYSNPRLLNLFLLTKLETRTAFQGTPLNFVAIPIPVYIMPPAIPKRYPSPWLSE